ncbi:MAG TPA: hypothetical protein VF929_02945 [Gemmatimonadaceae bacterium]
MNAEQQLIDSGLRAWKFNADRIETFFHALSEDQLQQEVALGRNRLLYLWGHLAAANDGLFPLLGIGPRLHPELDAMFIANPDRAVPSTLSHSELESAWREIHGALWSAFSGWTAAEWVQKHTAVSDEDFLRESHRNRYTVMLSRNTHMAYHYGQVILATPRT